MNGLLRRVAPAQEDAAAELYASISATIASIPGQPSAL